MPHAVTPRILFIDAYDSFTNNIVSQLETNLRVVVTVIKIDDAIEDFARFLQPFTAIVAGPGPGNPKNPNDVGLINELWRLRVDDVLPVLGICLGFQSLVLAFGGKVEPLPEPRHGMMRKIRLRNKSIFAGIEDVVSVQYHSLHASIGHCIQRPANGTSQLEDLWRSTKCCPDLVPLAWDNNNDNQSSNMFKANPSSILMGVAHKNKPFYGIQFHPESICSNENARKVIAAWWNIACRWKGSTPKIYSPPEKALVRAEDARAITQAMDMDKLSSRRDTLVKDTWPGGSVRSCNRICTEHVVKSAKAQPKIRAQYQRKPTFLHQKEVHKPLQLISANLDVGQLTIPVIGESLGVSEKEIIILDSELHQRSVVGTHSIIGIITPGSLKLEYTVGSNEVRQVCDGKTTSVDLSGFAGDIFVFLDSFMKDHQAQKQESEVPFWGGLMGYITYEACLETIDIGAEYSEIPQDTRRPDLSFIFVERSIVIDHQQQKLHVQSIRRNDHAWVNETAFRLSKITLTKPTLPPVLSFEAQVSYPNPTNYKSKIRACQTSIHAGDSYELCLTNQIDIQTPTNLPSWPLYLQLRYLNPAPFSAYIRLGGLTLLSSSPERFLRWSRPALSPTSTLPNRKVSTCQFRPIKGTVKRIPRPGARPVTLAEATAILSTPKERAENLMIVDLIRHDLYGVVGSGNVKVSKLMTVEEYATLYQLVTVIEGDLITNDDSVTLRNSAHISDHSLEPLKEEPKEQTGISVLAASLPPGSMAGAPKRRSCHILKGLENRKRGLYSGVLGYLDVGGGGDFSVVIRSAVRWDDDNRQQSAEKIERNGDDKRERNGDKWSIGAGGAVTALSEEKGEWEEMLTKLRSTLAVFEEQA